MDSLKRGLTVVPLCGGKGAKWSLRGGGDKKGRVSKAPLRSFFTFLCRYLCEKKMPTSQTSGAIMCETASVPKSLAPDPRRPGLVLWECRRCALSVSIGSVIGSLLAQGPGDLSCAEKAVVRVMYGCCNPLSESPDVYPAPYFLLLKEPGPGILNPRRD